MLTGNLKLTMQRHLITVQLDLCNNATMKYNNLRCVRDTSGGENSCRRATRLRCWLWWSARENEMGKRREPCKWGGHASEFLSDGKNLGMYVESVRICNQSILMDHFLVTSARFIGSRCLPATLPWREGKLDSILITPLSTQPSCAPVALLSRRHLYTLK